MTESMTTTCGRFDGMQGCEGNVPLTEDNSKEKYQRRIGLYKVQCWNENGFELERQTSTHNHHHQYYCCWHNNIVINRRLYTPPPHQTDKKKELECNATELRGHCLNRTRRLLPSSEVSATDNRLDKIRSATVVPIRLSSGVPRQQRVPVMHGHVPGIQTFPI